MKISIITTSYNRKDYLLETIKSVQQSIFIPLSDISFEHIIYDDASTDGTPELFRDLPYQNVLYIRSEINNGPSFGRNRAIEKATGDYVFMIDSDDILLQRTLYHFAQAALKEPQTNWFMSDFLQVDQNLKYLIGHDYYAWKFDDIESQLTSIFNGEQYIQSNVFFKRSLFTAVGGFDENMCMSEDLDLFIRFLLSGSAPTVCHFYSHLHRQHEQSLSYEMNKEKHLEEIKKITKKYHYALKKYNISTLFRNNTL